MKQGPFLLAIDQGTTGSRAILYSKNLDPIESAYQEFPQIFPKSGWVEHDPERIWSSVCAVLTKVFRKNPNCKNVAALGITNQRETTVLWNRKTGRPVYNAIVWQDRRTAELCGELRKRGHEKAVRDKTGLVLDPYFSGTKIAWILKHNPNLRRKAKRGEILFGTIDTWLLWKLTEGRVHATDPTNASRTLLYNIHTRTWDDQLLKILNVPKAILPEIRESGSDFGVTRAQRGLPRGIPVRAVMGDQQAALYGQSCYHKGEVKNTYGTGCFTVMNLGPKRPKEIPYGLLGTLACDENGQSVYALEGSVFIGGAVIQWIRDGLKFIKNASEVEAISKKVKDAGGVVFVPAFSGLGSPYWNPYAKGMISGITRGTTRQHIIRAAVESIAQQSADVIEQMKKTGVEVQTLKVDGGATRNKFLMQTQADLLRIPIFVSDQAELTALGAAKLAGKAAGVISDLKSVDRKARYHRFDPKMLQSQARRLREVWKKEIERVSF